MFSTIDVALACRVSDTTIRRWIYKGILEEVGKDSKGRRFWTQADLDRFVIYADSRSEVRKKMSKKEPWY